MNYLINVTENICEGEKKERDWKKEYNKRKEGKEQEKKEGRNLVKEIIFC